MGHVSCRKDVLVKELLTIGNDAGAVQVGLAAKKFDCQLVQNVEILDNIQDSKAPTTNYVPLETLHRC